MKDELDESSGKLKEARDIYGNECNDAALTVLQRLLADPAAMYPVAEAHGLKLEHFAQADARNIFAAIVHNHAKGWDGVYPHIKEGLQGAGLWGAGNLGEMRWSDRILHRQVMMRRPDRFELRLAIEDLLTRIRLHRGAMNAYEAFAAIHEEGGKDER